MTQLKSVHRKQNSVNYIYWNEFRNCFNIKTQKKSFIYTTFELQGYEAEIVLTQVNLLFLTNYC